MIFWDLAIDAAVVVAVVFLLLLFLGTIMITQEAIRCIRDGRRYWPRGTEAGTYQKAEDIPDVEINPIFAVTPGHSELDLPRLSV